MRSTSILLNGHFPIHTPGHHYSLLIPMVIPINVAFGGVNGLFLTFITLSGLYLLSS